MMNEKLTAVEHSHVHPFKRFSWTAVFVGALIGVGLGFLLNLFGMAIGLSAITFDNDGAMMVAIGGLIGMLIGVIVSMMVAGYAAGYLGRLYCPQRNLGMMYGFTTWAVALMLSALATAHITHYVSVYTNNLSPTVTVVPGSQNQVAESVTVDTVTTVPAKANQKSLKVNTSTTHLAWGAIAVFLLFFIGAVASCIGAHFGMRCKRED